MSIESWNKQRAVLALIEVARDAAQGAEATLNQYDEGAESALAKVLFEARRSLHNALILAEGLDFAATMRPSQPSGPVHQKKDE